MSNILLIISSIFSKKYVVLTDEGDTVTELVRWYFDIDLMCTMINTNCDSKWFNNDEVFSSISL